MSAGRLPAHLEVGGLIRRAEAAGGFAMVLAKGDAERGAVALILAERGIHHGCLERRLGLSGAYDWEITGPPAGSEAAEVKRYAESLRRFDPDTWLIELDIPHPERFIAETTAIG